MDKWLKDAETNLGGLPEWLQLAYKKLKAMPEGVREVREVAESDLYFFAKLVNPGYMYGSVHREIFKWLETYSLYGIGEGLTTNKLIMLPRAHLKSHMVATWCAWVITRHPEVTILYTSATSNLAETQLYDIKNILDGTQFQKYWPEYIKPDVGKREKWSSVRITIDHPRRKEEGIRDATLSAAGLTTNTTGWHADIVIADDLVVPENAYTEDGRESVSKKASQFTSIRNAGGFTLACGTRYHPADIYAVWKEQMYRHYNEAGEYLGDIDVWEVQEYKVEVDNIFIWPRAVRTDGKAFGFNIQVLERIRAEYSDTIQFFAQYYNDPNDPASDRISRDRFQYYNPRHLKKSGSSWYYAGRRLNIYAAIDFAFSLRKQADYTAIVVIGMDCDKRIYVLDIDRFKSFKTLEYFQHIAVLHSKWGFKKLQAEVTVAQKTIVESIKDHVRKDGLRLSVDEYRPSKAEGSKEERIAAALEHRYENLEVWHNEGGWTPVLEDELILARPRHDDIKDAMASAVSIAIAPARSRSEALSSFFPSQKTNIQSRFGGFV